MFLIPVFLALISQLDAAPISSAERIVAIDNQSGFFWKPEHKRAAGEEGTETSEDRAAAFFFKPERYGKRSAELPDSLQPAAELPISLQQVVDKLQAAAAARGFFMKPKNPLHMNKAKRAVAESSTEGPQDAFFFRPRGGKRSAENRYHSNIKRGVSEQGTESSEDAAAGFFFKPGGKRSADLENSYHDNAESYHDNVKRAVEHGTESTHDELAGFFFRPRAG